MKVKSSNLGIPPQLFKKKVYFKYLAEELDAQQNKCFQVQLKSSL
jgi:hypothetical protein